MIGTLNLAPIKFAFAQIGGGVRAQGAESDQFILPARKENRLIVDFNFGQLVGLDGGGGNGRVKASSSGFIFLNKFIVSNR